MKSCASCCCNEAYYLHVQKSSKIETIYSYDSSYNVDKDGDTILPSAVEPRLARPELVKGERSPQVVVARVRQEGPARARQGAQ